MPRFTERLRRLLHMFLMFLIGTIARKALWVTLLALWELVFGSA